MGKVIHWELCKKFKFGYTIECYIYKPGPFVEIVMHKIIWDFEIQSDHLFPLGRPDLVTLKKEEREFAVLILLSDGHRVKRKESKKIFELCQRIMKSEEHEGDGALGIDPNDLKREL